jgi:hypothetical protein
MEAMFYLAKELHQPFSEILEADFKDSKWLVNRLEKWYKDQEKVLEKVG